MKFLIKFLSILTCISYSNLSFSNPINNISLFDGEEGLYNFYVEIPAGSKEKWEVNKDLGILEYEKRNNGDKRIIRFLGYPGNYGFIPQTLANDGDPMDIIDLEESISRGSISKIRIIGGLYFKDKNKEDIKFIGVKPDGVFKDIENINQLLLSKPNVLEILKSWFLSYKKPGKMVFFRYIDKDESEKMIIEGNTKWKTLLEGTSK